MPPRTIVGLILVFWLFSIAYLVYREYWPWWRTNAPPPFLVELADEAEPLVAHWSIQRGDQKVGSAITTMTCLKDNTIELSSTINNFEFNVHVPPFPPVSVKVPTLHTMQRVTRDGQLVSVRSRLQLHVMALGLKLEFKASLTGRVRDGKLYATSTLDSPLGRSEHELEPIDMQMGNVLNPMQPIAKVRVRPGQHWKMSNVDPLGEAFNLSIQHLLGQLSKESKPIKLKVQTPKVLLARVASEPRTWSFETRSVSCHVIEYKSEDDSISGSTWVAVESGMVMRQEIVHLGERLVMERDD